MPRCVDVICRNEIVELAKAGDKMIFTGTVAVIPDASGLARAGESTTSAKSGGRNDGFGDGVAGLKKLGVKEMTYKLLFIASAVQHTDQRTGGPVNGVSLAELSGINNTSEVSFPLLLCIDLCCCVVG
jgi:DNA replication licensing factor MCM6